MAYIDITFPGVVEANRTLRNAQIEIGHAEDTLLRLKGQLSPDIQSRYQIAERLSACCRSAAEIHYSLDAILEVVNIGLQEYRSTEARLNRIAPSDADIFEMR